MKTIRNESLNKLLKTIRNENLYRLIYTILEIKSIWNKSELISETKINDSSPITNVLIDSFSKLYETNRNSSCGGIIMIYVREDTSSNLKDVTLSITGPKFN